MQTSSSSTSQALLSSPSSFPSQLHKARLHRRSPSHVCLASTRDAHGRDSEGRLVDESMIVLRMRIHEMKMAERNYEPPSHWMEWEKLYYTSYGSDVSELMGLLQSLLMNTRPGLAIGMAIVVILSLPTSMIIVLHHLVDAIGSIAPLK